MSSFQDLSPLVYSFAESATLALATRAKKMILEGKSVINFSVGEPDFNTPKEIIEKAYEAALVGETKYTAVAGVPGFRKALVERIKLDYGVQFEPEEAMASNGGKQSIFHFFQAILRPQDEVLIFSPYWTSFPEMVKLAGGKPRILSSREGRPDFDKLKEALNVNTRAFILNSPSNPSGIVWTEAEIEELVRILNPHPIWILSDDTYYQLVYSPQKFCSILQLAPEFRERTCIVGSASKSYAMTGWRLGWALGPKHLIQAMTKIQGQVTSSPSSLSQAAVAYALQESQQQASSFRRVFDQRRNLVKSLLESKKIEFLEPQGAFYYFIKLAGRVSPESVTGFCERLLEEHGVCIVPGEAFGEPDYARLSYAVSENEIQEGIRRLFEALKA